MENIGSEIGQKMRSAVKAKLVELGTGGTSGYIDDELPDYVMIMVANKRSKQQMIIELNLFLGDQTELFVTWLHEVLQKLQEVTIPLPLTSKKHKPHPVEVSGKKDKGGERKEKKDKKNVKRSSQDNATIVGKNDSSNIPVVSSITDVFAEDILSKAQKSLKDLTETAVVIKKGKLKKSPSRQSSNTETQRKLKTTNEFDIPTISEITSTTTEPTVTNNPPEGVNREKDLAELAELQKQIDATKKHLKEIGQLPKDLESEEDEDFLHLTDEDSNDFNEIGDVLAKKNEQTKVAKVISPIIFDKRSKSISKDQLKDNCIEQSKADQNANPLIKPKPIISAAVNTASVRSTQPTAMEVPFSKSDRNTSHGEVKQRRSRDRERGRSNELTKKRSVHDRLGFNPNSRDRHDRIGRNGKEKSNTSNKHKDLSAEKNNYQTKQYKRDIEHRRLQSERNGRRDGRVRRRSPLKHRSATPNDERIQPPPQSCSVSLISNQSQPRRIGSRVIVAPMKAANELDDDRKDKSVNSIIKITPRPPMSPRRQASSNLLMRAVAEAQRSTILAIPKRNNLQTSNIKRGLIDSELNSVTNRNTKLYTKSYRDKLRRNVNSKLRSTTDDHKSPSIIIELNSDYHDKKNSAKECNESFSSNETDETYAQAAIFEHDNFSNSLEYIPQIASDPTSEEAISDEHSGVNFYEQYNSVENISTENTKFVVTLNDKSSKIGKIRDAERSNSTSPISHVNNSPNYTGNSNQNTYSDKHANLQKNRQIRKKRIKSRLSSNRLSSPNRRSSITSNATPPLLNKSENTSRKTKDVKKSSVKNASEYEEHNIVTIALEHNQTKKSCLDTENDFSELRSTTPPLPEDKLRPLMMEHARNMRSLLKRKHVPITFDLNVDNKNQITNVPSNVGESNTFKKRRSNSSDFAKRGVSRNRDKDHERSRERDRNRERERDRDRERERERERDREHERDRERIRNCDREHEDEDEFDPDYNLQNEYRHKDEEESFGKNRTILIKMTEATKYENIPSLSSVSMDSIAVKVMKPKERCKYHPNCSKQFCEFYHPTASCKSFPNCKFAEKCLYSHPKCKYDTSCTNIDCNFSHSGPRNPNVLQFTAPPLSSHVVPVQNYKSISATASVSNTMCKYYPNCNKVGCTFYHPKPCRFGKNCINKLECNFYHYETQSSNKFKWVASIV